MEEIKVGEYIRTKDGCIFKATEYWLGECYSDRVNIKKHRPNIINLIEEGDYVNGMEVTEIGSEHREIKVLYYNGYYTDNLTLTEADINSVVTKEQFEQMKYIVGDESSNVNKGVD